MVRLSLSMQLIWSLKSFHLFLTSFSTSKSPQSSLTVLRVLSAIVFSCLILVSPLAHASYVNLALYTSYLLSFVYSATLPFEIVQILLLSECLGVHFCCLSELVMLTLLAFSESLFTIIYLFLSYYNVSSQLENTFVEDYLQYPPLTPSRLQGTSGILFVLLYSRCLCFSHSY